MESDSLRGMLHDFFNVGRGRADYNVIRERIMDGARIDGIHVLQLIAAILIASIGLNMNSAEAVIGAMLICPIMGSVLAIACSIAQMDIKSLKSSIWGLVVQVGVSLVTSTLYFVLSPISTETSYLLTNSMATVWDVLIALVGGFAGGLGNSRRDTPSTLIAGVAVATALMPPLCSSGFGIATRDLTLALSAFYEFCVNVVFICFGAELILIALKMPLFADLNGDGIVSVEEQVLATRRSERLRRLLVVGSIIFAIPCLFFSARVVRQSLDTTGSVFELKDTWSCELTTMELEAVCPELVSYRIGREDSFDGDRIVQRVVATVETSTELDPVRQRQLEDLIRLNVGELDEVTFEVSEDETAEVPAVVDVTEFGQTDAPETDGVPETVAKAQISEPALKEGASAA